MTGVTDPVRLEVLKHVLEGIADGMGITLVRTARSTGVRTAWDFSTGLLSPDGELLSQGLGHPIHIGGMMPALKACLERYGDRVRLGDIWANNDPYEGGSHLPDIYLYKPVFVEDVLVAYLCTIAHHVDVGGRVAGSQAFDSTEIYQEGLRIPPLKLFDGGVPNETLYRIIEKAVRVPEQMLGDLQAQVSALYAGERECVKLVERLGIEEFDSGTRELLDYTERLTRNAIRPWPDGTWSFTDYIDDDGIDPGPITIAVTLTKQDDRLYVDFTGTSPQSKGAIQPTFDTTKGMVYAVARSVLGGAIPNTAGQFRPITVTAPEGSFVYPLPPAPVAARQLGCRRINHAVWGAFAHMVPNRVFACPGGADSAIAAGGYDKKKSPWKAWVLIEGFVEVACGGRPDKDGMEGQGTNISNLANVPVEIMEIDHPIKVLDYGFPQDTEGAGRFRGGLGLRRSYEFLDDEIMVQIRFDRCKQPPWGLFGGESAAPPRVVLNPNGPNEQVMRKKFRTTFNGGDRLEVQWCGGGGYSAPLERDPERVLEDVIAEKVSLQRARDIYGVVIDAGSRQVDLKATEELRSRKGRERAPNPQSDGTAQRPKEEDVVTPV